MIGRVLSVTVSDSSGASGIQADVKTMLAFGCYTTTAVTGIAAQDTYGIKNFYKIDAGFVAEQMRLALNDIGADVIKTGILGRESIINSVSDVLDDVLNEDYIIVVDPSIVGRDAKAFLSNEAIATLKRRLLVRANILTPNRREAELLTGIEIKDLDDMRHAAEMMITFGAEAVFLKGGQLTDSKVINLLVYSGGEEILESPVYKTRHIMGAGCTLSAAIAAALSDGNSLLSAVERAVDFLNSSIEQSLNLGKGIGPINHGHSIPYDISFK